MIEPTLKQRQTYDIVYWFIILESVVVSVIVYHIELVLFPLPLTLLVISIYLMISNNMKALKQQEEKQKE